MIKAQKNDLSGMILLIEAVREQTLVTLRTPGPNVQKGYIYDAGKNWHVRHYAAKFFALGGILQSYCKF